VTGTYFIINDSGNTVTYKATREQFVPFNFGPSNTIVATGNTVITGSLSVGSSGNAVPGYINGIYAIDGFSRFLQVNILQARFGGKLSFNDGNAYIAGGSEGGTDFMSFFTQNTNRFHIFNGGNVSIGYGNNPTDNGYKLQVDGDINAQYFYNTTTNTGLLYTNQISIGDRLTDLYFLSGSTTIGTWFKSTGNLRIGTGSTDETSYKLLVDGSVKFRLGGPSFAVMNNGGSAALYGGYVDPVSNPNGYFARADGANSVFKIPGSGGTMFFGGVSESDFKMALFGNGNFAIGTTTDNGNKLQVYGGGNPALFKGSPNPYISVIDNSNTIETYLGVVTTGPQYGRVGTNNNYDFAIMTNNTPRILTTNSGNVLIGATSVNNSGAKLQVTGLAYVSDGIGINTGGGNWDYTTYKLYVSGNIKVTGFTDTNTIFSSTLNTLSISTLYPNTYLDFITWGGGNLLRLYDSGNLLIGSTTDNGTGAKLQVNGIGWFTSSVPGNGGVTVSSSANQPAIVFTNSVGVGKGSLIINGGSQEFYNFISNVNGGNFNFYTNTSTLIAKLTSSGNLLLGTPNDDGSGAKLQVSGTSKMTDTLLINNTSVATLRLRGGNYGGQYDTTIRSLSGAQGVLQFGNNDINYIIAGNGGTGGYLTFRVNATGETVTSGIEAMRITSGGNVLIGTTTDDGTKLVVKGSLFVNSSVAGFGDTDTSYFLMNLTTSVSSWGIYSLSAGEFLIKNNNFSANTYPINISRTATDSILIGGNANTVQIYNNLGIGNWSNIYTIPNKLAVIGGASIQTTEALAAGNASSVLFALNSTTQGLLKPRMTSTQVNAISSPATGLELFNTTTNSPQYYNGSSWASFMGTTSGTTNYVPKFISSGTTLTNSIIYDNGTTVGIGTTSLSSIFKLVIGGSLNIQGGTTISDDAGSIGFYNTVGDTQTGAIFFNKYVGTYILNTLNLPLKFGVNNSEAMRITQSGNLLIGTTTESPYDAKLRVYGNGHFDGYVVVGSTLYGGAVQVNGVIMNTDNLIFYTTGGTQAMKIMASNGNVLIGRSTDGGYKLDVSGTSRFSNSMVVTGGTIQQGNPGGYTFTIDGGNGTGPRLGLGSSPSAGYDFFVIGAYNGENNFDTVGRNFVIRSTISSVNDVRFKLFSNTGNVLIQNGGTFTDNGYRLDVSGSTRISGSLSLGPNAIDVTTGYGNYISNVIYPITTSSDGSTFWIRVINNGNNIQRIKLLLYGGSDNTISYDEFEIAVSGYNMPHNILRKPTTIYNTSKIVGILTSNPTGAQVEVWINVLGTTVSNGYFNIYSNISLDTLANMQASKTTTKPTKANNGTELIINDYKRTNYTIQTSNGAEFNGPVTANQKLEVSGDTLLQSVTATTINATGSSSTFSTAYIGDVYGSNVFASFSHTSRRGNDEYSFLSDSGGYTYVNAKSGRDVLLRINNDTKLQVGSNGNVSVNNGTFSIKQPGNGTAYMYIGDSTNNYSLTRYTNINSTWEVGALITSQYAITNSLNNNAIITISADAYNITYNNTQLSMMHIVNNNLNFYVTRLGIGYSNIYTIPNPLTVIGATSISTVETGLTPSNSSSVLLSLNSTTQGFLKPRMTTTQINAISSPDTGLEAYNTTLQQPCFYDGTGWRKVSYSDMNP
jgi:hypothetical protein